MPYKNLSDLPDSVRDNLPKHAQEIYQAAYKVAWAAVKNDYEKKGDRWVKKES